MNANDRGAMEDGGDKGGDACRFPCVDGDLLSAVQRGKRVAEEGFPGQAGEKGRLARQESVILAEFLAEPVAGIEDDGFRCNSGAGRSGETFGEACADGLEECIWRKLRLRTPFARTAAGMHEDDAAADVCADRGNA